MSIIRSRHFLIGVALVLAFVPLTYLPPIYLFDLVNALTVAVGIGVLVAYGPGIFKSFQQPRWDGSHYLVLGITATWTATAGRHLWNWAWRFMGKPPDMIDHWMVAFMVWLAFMGGVLHLTAKGAIGGEIPRENWIRLGVVVACGLATAFIVMVFFEPAFSLAATRGH